MVCIWLKTLSGQLNEEKLRTIGNKVKSHGTSMQQINFDFCNIFPRPSNPDAHKLAVIQQFLSFD